MQETTATERRNKTFFCGRDSSRKKMQETNEYWMPNNEYWMPNNEYWMVHLFFSAGGILTSISQVWVATAAALAGAFAVWVHVNRGPHCDGGDSGDF